MSTRSNIGCEYADGSVRFIYCHFDGYIEYVGTILKQFYDEHNIDYLLDLGDLSVLGKSVDCPDGHSFNTPHQGYCVAYERDRGERDCESRLFDSLEDYINSKRYAGIDYIYILRNNKWYVSDGFHDSMEFKEF